MNPINAKQIIGSIIVLAVGIGIFLVLWNDKMYRSEVAAMLPATEAQSATEKQFPGIGKPPVKDFNGYPSVKEYLQKTLHDYDGAEFVSWSEPSPVSRFGESYWSIDLRLRAKNGFGAKIVKDMKFLIKDEHVMASE